ncbi:hypothetical protein [Ferrimicrobium sp.]|uniref:hypothetical protein n=1 Tax=Ferrimicrobium sp. TaxID=2926050 RepID=UPI002639469B|nr:hypothetical protein [Ferrimicrobium sp.]
MEEHGTEWAIDLSIDVDEFFETYRDLYLPLLRCTEVSEDLLTKDEAERLAKLARIDPDDVPSAALAMVFGAWYLTKDRKARECVYGSEVDHKLHDAWLKGLAANGDVTAILTTYAVGYVVVVSALIGKGIAGATRAIWNKSPWFLSALLAGLAGLGTFAWKRYGSKESRHTLGEGIEVVLEIIAGGYDFLTQCQAEFELRFPVSPERSLQSEQLEGAYYLTRQCLFSLARLPEGNASARELYDALRLSVTGQERTIRTILRTQACFVEVGRGRWQVGKSVGA